MPTRLSIPRSPADLTPSWLSAALGAAVDEVRIDPVGTGQTGATYRMVPTYAATVDLPSTFVVKLPSQDDAVRERCALGYRAEHAFYRELAHTVAVPLPINYYCDIDSGGMNFVLLLADLAPATQGDQINGCLPAQARLAVEALAGLHGPRWCDPTLLEFTGATMPKPDHAFARGMGELARTATVVTLDRLGPRMSNEDQACLSEAADLVANWLMLEPDRFALLHGDFRLDNLMFTPDGSRVTVVDWQTITIGLPARDLSYFVSTSLQPRGRAEHEHDLVAHYHRALQSHGVRGFSLESCWSDYRLGLLQVPLLTTLGYAFTAATDRGDEMVLTMLHRGCTAIREHDVLALIGHLSSS